MLIKKSLQTAYAKLNAPYVIPEFLDKSYFPSLDGWRAVAILLVILGHAKFTTEDQSIFYTIFNIFIYPLVGVKIFFVLSGFLITSLLLKEFILNKKINIKFFFIKRTLRIFPVLYLYLFIVFILNYAFKLHLTFDHFLGPLLYLSNFRFFDGTWLTGHTWTLAVEEQFYLIWPFILSYFTKHLWAFCLFMIVWIQLYKIFAHFNPEHEISFLMCLFGESDGIFVGAFFAVLSFKGFITTQQRIWFAKKSVVILTIALFSICYFESQGQFGVLLLPFGNLSVLILISLLLLYSILNYTTILYKILNKPFMIQIGVLSYSLYIWQQLFIIPNEHRYGEAFNWSFFPVNILFTFIVAYISYYFYEVYFLQLKTKLTKVQINRQFNVEHSN